MYHPAEAPITARKRVVITCSRKTKACKRQRCTCPTCMYNGFGRRVVIVLKSLCMLHMPAKRDQPERPVGSQPYHGVQPRTVAIKRTYQATTVGTDTGTFKAIGAYDFKLSYLPAYTDFTNLFDQYRIVKVKIEFIPNLTGNGAPGTPVCIASSIWRLIIQM